MKFLFFPLLFFFQALSLKASPEKRPVTPTNSEEVLKLRNIRFKSLQVTPGSFKKDVERNLPRLTGHDLETFKIYFNKEDSFLFNLQNKRLKYQIIYFFHRNGSLYGMPVSYSEDEGFQHSSFDTKEMTDCVMAGEMNITSEKIYINDDSGHYKPESDSKETKVRIAFVISYLRSLGVTLPIEISSGGF